MMAAIRPTTAAAGCESYDTCARCANAPGCGWSVRKQACGTGWPAAGSCPTFAVDRQPGPDGSSTITVTVSDRSAELVGVLAGSADVKCVVNAKRYDATVDGDRIVCRTSRPGGDRWTARFLWVVFDGTRLRFDHILDHYVTEYPAGVPDDCRRTGPPCVSCAWDDDQSVRFYCSRCAGPDDGRCGGPYRYCDVRAPPDYKRLRADEIRRAVKATAVGDQCPAARIAGFRPDRGPRAGGTAVRIDVHGALFEPRSLVDVTVAGRRCVDVTVGSKSGALTCTVTAAEAEVTAAAAADAGPVEVTYYADDADSSSLNLTVRSAGNFSFVDEPAVAAVRPDSGPVTGGTALAVDGAFDADGADVRVYAAGDVPCEIAGPVRPDRLLCVTGPSDRPRSGPVRVVFGGPAGRRTVYGARFEYVPTPALDRGQSWSGIASGGTVLRVRGTGFSRAPNVTVYVADGPYGPREGRCRAANDTHMTCRTPALDAGPSARTLPCGFVAHYAGTGPVPFAEYEAGYRVHPDPAFADFEADGCCDVTVNDANPGRGYGAGDVTVRLPSSSVGGGGGGDADAEAECTAPADSGQRVVCRLRRWPSPDPETIVVAAGDSPARNVTRRRARFYNNPFTAIVWPSVTIAAYVLFIAFLCVALTLLRAPKTYDLSVLANSSRRSAAASRPSRRRWRRWRRRGDGDSGGSGGDNCESARPISLERYG